MIFSLQLAASQTSIWKGSTPVSVWQQVQLGVTETETTYKIIILATRGDTAYGSVALDDISIINEECHISGVVLPACYIIAANVLFENSFCFTG